MSAEQPSSDAAPSTAKVSLYAWYIACALMVVQVLSSLDRRVIVILAEPIKRDLGLSDTELGLLSGGLFSFVYAAASFPIARIAERVSRPRLISASIAAWSLLTACGGFAQGFAMLAFSRVGVAAGEAGAGPAAHSLLTSHFPPTARSRALSIYMAGVPLGGLAGLVLGGVLSDLFDWRTALFIVGLPGILIAMLIAFTVREPRTPTAYGKPPSSSLLQMFGICARDPVLRLMLIAMAIHVIPNGSLNAFLPAYVMREFGLPAHSVGLAVGLVLGLGGLTGSLVGGWCGDWLNLKDRSYAFRFVSFTFLLDIILVLLILVTKQYPALLALAMLQAANIGLSAGPLFATLQDRVSDGQRATAAAILLFCVYLGSALGPVIAGMLSDWISTPGQPAALSLRQALMYIAPIEAVGAYYLLRASGHLKGTSAKMM
ncbi:MFS transporter [Sphingomonas sp. C8-2]|nr:MFS transporter [Sphingomonas sp. C8-2]